MTPVGGPCSAPTAVRGGSGGGVDEDGGRTVDTDGPRGRQIVSRMFSAAAGSVPVARRWTRRQLRLAGADEETIGRVELMVSEAVTNVVQHTRMTRFLVRVDVDDHLEVAVHDGD